MSSIMQSLGKMKFITLNREIHKWAGIVLSIGVLVITVTGFALLHDKSWKWLKRTEVPSLVVPALAVEGERGKSQDVKALATTTDGNTEGPVVIGTKAGLYQTSGDGIAPLALPAGETEITALLLSDERWLVGTPRGLFSSLDHGKSWDAITDGPWGETKRARVNALAASPASSNTVYAGTKMGVYRSLDGGAHWDDLSGRFAEAASHTGASEEAEKKQDVTTIAFAQDHPATVLFGSHRGLYRYESDEDRLSMVDLSAAMANVAAPPMTLAKYLNDLHTGKLFAHKLWVLYDAIAIGLVLFVATGLYIWIYPKSVKWKKEREQAQLREARTAAPATVTGDRPLPHRG